MLSLRRLFFEENGQGLVEYGLLVVLVIVLVVAALTVFGDSLVGLFKGIDSDIENAENTIVNN